MFNPLTHPIALTLPERLTPVSAWTQHIPFGMALIDMVRPSTVVELGTHAGDSYCAFCQAVQQLGLNTQCWAVDTWRGDEHTTFYGAEVLEELREHHDPRYDGFSRLIESTFDDALELFEPGSIDLLHVDGCHNYDAVKHDYEVWLDRMSDRGVIVFHDTNERREGFGVWRLWAELRSQHRCFEFHHGHGLGIALVGDVAPLGLAPLLEAEGEAVEAIRQAYSALGQRLEAQRTLAATRRELADLRREVADVTSRVADATSRAADATNRVSQLEHELSEQRATGARERAALERERAGFERERAGFERERAGFEREESRLERERSDVEHELDRARAELARARGDVARAELATERTRDEMDAVEERLSRERDRERALVEAARAGRARLDEELAVMRVDRDDARARVEQLAGRRISELEAEADALREKLSEEQGSVGLKLVKIQRDVVDRLLPVHSKRREPYVRATQLIGRLIGGDAQEAPQREPDAPPPARRPPIVRVTREPVDARISVVIPTKNGEAQGLAATLRALRTQQGVGELEIAVVDSGSTDRTIEIARSWGASVHQIDPDDFDHGATRMLGAQRVGGELVLFTVQDAVLGADDVLYEMARMLASDPGLAVVSARQVPRADADLFSGWQLWNHYRHLGADTRITSVGGHAEIDSLTPRERWRRACVDDVCSLHRRAVLSEIQLATTPFAEDVEYGLRCLDAGWRVGFLGERAVVHSHSRPARYQLSSHYVVRTTLAPMLGDVDAHRWDGTGVGSIADLSGSARDLYVTLKGFGATIDEDAEHDVDRFFDGLGRSLASEPLPGATDLPGDPSLDPLLASVDELTRPAADAPTRCREVFAWNVDNLWRPYLEGRYRAVPGEELLDLVYSAYGMTVGAELGDFAAMPVTAADAPQLAELDAILRSGVVR